MSDSNRTGPLGGRSGGSEDHNDNDRCGADGNRSSTGCGIRFERGPGRESDGRR